MFTLDQIKAIHSRVKSGADFPQYVQELKALGVLRYDLYVADGHAEYVGPQGYSLASAPGPNCLTIAASGSPAQLTQALGNHQQGLTDYPTFCHQAAEAGVEKWTINILEMTCTYYDRQAMELLVERIPLP
ncbi:DUF1398 family protein [Hymenobacter sp. RP-2-7]|uniref:DUF1398 family protein n=1 Tax=Hymenobacter polaris TaxID=2682546 RepID=A0A7Y0ADP1_9BACT|nr:DUF1398 family protein [Hymenobacter polaris]NML65468.1 DUF1398 family protein [Hymenobacter polaris]